MKFAVVVLVAAVAVAHAGLAPIVPAATLLRTPQFDSAIITSDRVGGNFAYSSVEGHAYQAVAPYLRTAIHPVALNYEVNALPFGIPTLHYAHLPVLSQLAPTQSFEISSDAGKLAQTPEIKPESPAAEGAKVEGDSVTVDSSA